MTMAPPRTPHARLGISGTAALIAVLLLALSGDTVSSLIGARSYRAAFAEAGGISPDDSVVVSGMVVGKVTAVELDDDQVEISFVVSDDSVRLGDQSRAAIKAQTALGKKSLELTPSGASALAEGAEIPLARTLSPYDITEALSDLTQNVSEIDTDQLGKGLNTVSDTLSAASSEVKPALQGVQRLSDTINARDGELSELLRHSANVSGLLAERRGQIQTLLADGSTLLSELNSRSDAITQLLTRATSLAQQVSGLVADNEKQIGPAFDQLNGAMKLLRDNKKSIDEALTQGVSLIRELGSVVASTPGINIYVPNLVATNVVPTLPGLLTGGGK
ncbi:MCE family protein [Amycolatopsis silviterrae]|uniref:MCE family protein n=1 Tax=Amycolatopsis silviterrae TaxID=1656914 RepID=A0ABW5HK71_9PSEU